MQKKILLIEDDKDILFLIKMHLTDAGYLVETVTDGTLGLARSITAKFDLVILDVMLPGIDGISLCRELRGQKNYLPILMLTARSSESDRVLGLEMGADDYLTKPFSLLELGARIKALIRRSERQIYQSCNTDTSPIISHDGLELDKARHIVSIDHQPIELTRREFDLLYHFASHPGLVFSRAQLLDDVWGHEFEGYEHTVNTHINRLRGKIEKNPASPAFIQTVHGVGYRFCDQRAA